jgi:phosphoglycolate phosphatase
MTKHLHPKLATIAPELVIFDKGGTLISFHAMWTQWTIELAQHLEVTAGVALAGRLFSTYRFDPRSGQVAHDGPFATSTMAELREFTVEILCEAGLERLASEAAVASAWHAPDPVRHAHPQADLPALLLALRQHSLKIAVATVDDRAPSEATFAALGIHGYVDILYCGDDGLPVKPAPDMVQAICQDVGVRPAHTAVVGDSVTDLRMGRAAGAAMVIAVPTGVAPREVLEPHADLVLESVADLLVMPSEQQAVS